MKTDIKNDTNDTELSYPPKKLTHNKTIMSQLFGGIRQGYRMVLQDYFLLIRHKGSPINICL